MSPTTHPASLSPMPRPTASPSAGGRLVSTDGRPLPLASARLSVDACGGVARVALEQVFRNVYDEPLRVTYSLALPPAAAVGGFAFRIGDERVVGEVERREAARERFERALVEGHAAALLEEDRSSVFRQEVGNIPPKSEVVVEIALDQRLAWSSEGAWEWRFPTVVAPRYLGAEGRVPDAGRIAVDLSEQDPGARLALALVVRDAIAGGGRPSSPSHALAVSPDGGRVRVGFAEERGAPLDRDVVVRWPVAAPSVGVSLDLGRPGADRPHAGRAYALLTLVPPAPEHAPEPVPRDLIVLIDTSGSMSGPPIAQAKRVVGALIDTLSERDRVELIEFASRPRRFHWRPLVAHARHRAKARAWVEGLQAGGATEMVSGIREALRPLRGDAQRQILLVTDGLVGFEEEIVATLERELPRGARLHALGVGSAVNRSLIGPAARAGRGSHWIVGLDEDVEPTVRRVIAATAAPVLVDVELVGEAAREVAPARLPDVYAGEPARISLAVDSRGGEIALRGRTARGRWEATVAIPAAEPGSGSAAVVALYGRERVEDLEMRRAGGGEGAALDAEIERVGLEFQIATRLTSWVAVSERRSVDPRDPGRREHVPQALPYGMSVEGLGLREASSLLDLALARHRGSRSVADRTLSVSRQAVQQVSKRKAPPPESRDESGIGWRRVFGLRPAAPPRAASIQRILHGRLLFREGELAVFELELDAALAWGAPATVVVLHGGETERAVAVDASRSTRAARLEAGHVLRIALRLPAHVRAVDCLVVEGEGGFALLVDHG